MKVYVACVGHGDTKLYPYGVFGTREKAEHATNNFQQVFIFQAKINHPIPFEGLKYESSQPLSRHQPSHLPV